MLQEDQAEGDVLVVGRFQVFPEFVDGEEELGFDAERGGGGGGAFGRRLGGRFCWCGGWVEEVGLGRGGGAVCKGDGAAAATAWDDGTGGDQGGLDGGVSGLVPLQSLAEAAVSGRASEAGQRVEEAVVVGHFRRIPCGNPD